MKNIEQALNRHQDQIMAIPDVVGVGIGERDGKLVIIIMVKQLTANVKAQLPQALEGHPVVIEESGEIYAY